MKHINIQSISDIITNSSSEVFIAIESKDGNLLNDVYELIDKCLGFTSKKDSDLYIKVKKSYRNDTLCVSCPYSSAPENVGFFREGIDLILRRDLKDRYKDLKIDKDCGDFN